MPKDNLTYSTPKLFVRLIFAVLYITPNTTMAQYNNAVLSLTKTATPDPFVTYSAATRQFYLVSPDPPTGILDTVLTL